MRTRITVGIDPGLNGTGVAIFEGPTPVRTFVVPSPKQREDWWTRCREVADLVSAGLEPLAWQRRHQTDVVMETTQYMGTGRGWKTGDLQKLTFLDGVLYERLRGLNTFRLIKPQEWKGQLPKEIVEQRIRRLLGTKTCEQLAIKTHAWDATGIGLWALGRFE